MTTIETTPFTKTLLIPEPNMERLEASFAKVVRAAKRTSSPVPTLTPTGNVETKTFDRIDGFGRRYKTHRRYLEVIVAGEMPKLPGGWYLGWSIDHRLANAIVSAFPSALGEEMDPSYRERADCDHCKWNRRRVDTFVLINDQGQTLQVGRTCLRDFVGGWDLDPLKVASAFTSLISDALSCAGEPSEEGWARGETYFSIDTVVELALGCIDAFGWQRSNMPNPTRDDVGLLLSPPKKGHDDFYRQYVEMRDKVAEAIRTRDLAKEAREAIKWVSESTEANDYMQNLRALVENGMLRAKSLGLAVSLGAAWRKHVDQVVRKERTVKAFENSQWVGAQRVAEEKAERLTLKVTLFQPTRAFDGHYGTSYLHVFRDESGNRLTWFSSGKDLMDEREGSWKVGEERTIKATVKSHKEYRGIRETRPDARGGPALVALERLMPVWRTHRHHDSSGKVGVRTDA